MVFSGESCGEAIIAEFNVIDRSNALLTNPALVIRIILLRFAKCTHHASGPLGEPTQINNGRFCTRCRIMERHVPAEREQYLEIEACCPCIPLDDRKQEQYHRCAKPSDDDKDLILRN